MSSQAAWRSAAALAEPTIVVIPAYNEQEALPDVLRDLAQTLPGLPVVVVDDGSEDATAAVARDGGAACVRLPFNMGIGGALRTGFRYACEHGFRRAVQFDADGQHRAQDVPRLLTGLDDGAHLALGNRFPARARRGADKASERGPYARGDGEEAADARGYRVGVVRAGAMAVLRLGVRVLCGRWFRDPTSGLRAVSEPLLSVFAADYPMEYMDSTEALVAACRSGYRVTETPVQMSPRAAGTPSTGPVRLVYHYARLAVALVGGSRHRLPPAPSAPPANSSP